MTPPSPISREPTYAIQLLEPGFSGVIIGIPDAMAKLSEKLGEIGISHAYLFKHRYFNTPFGIQEHY